MGVEVIRAGEGEIDGYGDNMESFRTEHHNTTNILLNVSEGKKKNTPRPAYDPAHPDNEWPVMVYHPAKGELVVGANLKGLIDGLGEKNGLRARTEAANKRALADAMASGYRREPYVKPQVVVLDPAAEKAALQLKNRELEGHIVAQNDLILKMNARLDAIEKGASADPAK